MFKPERFQKKKRNFFDGGIITAPDNLRSNTVTATTADRIKQSLQTVERISGIPTQGEQHRIVTIKAIVTFDFILAVLASQKIVNLYIAVYRIGKKTLTELIALHKSQDIQNLFFLINTGMQQLTPGVYELLDVNKSANWRVVTAHTHTKIILMETTQGNFYVVEGSGNMSQNGKYEQYIFEENQPVYDFHRKWMEDL